MDGIGRLLVLDAQVERADSGERRMTEIQRAQLEIAKEQCEEEGRSDEYMLQYLQCVSGCSFDEALRFLWPQVAQERGDE